MSLLLGVLFNPLIVLLVIIGAVVYMKRARPGGSPGQRFARGLWIALLVLFTAGFGLCGGFGVVAGLASVAESGESRAYGLMFLVAGGIGVAIALLTGWALRSTLRRLRAPAAAPGVAEAGHASPWAAPDTTEAPRDDTHEDTPR